MALLLSAVTFFSFCATVLSKDIWELLLCEPTDVPVRGGYNPKQDFYYPGDVIHYYCEAEKYLEGDSNRTCEHSGSWSGEAPYCDQAKILSVSNQTSMREPWENNHSGLAIDEDRITCSSTMGEIGDTWTGQLYDPGEVKRVLIYSRPGKVHYEVFIVIPDGGKFSCGTRQESFERLTWHTHHCPSPFNNHVIGVEVKSLIAEPLELCEINVHGRLLYGCPKPVSVIPNGYLAFNRFQMELFCNDGFERSPDWFVMCLRTNVWPRKKLFCTEKRTPK